jgi:hypothetical protein
MNKVREVHSYYVMSPLSLTQTKKRSEALSGFLRHTSAQRHSAAWPGAQPQSSHCYVHGLCAQEYRLHGREKWMAKHVHTPENPASTYACPSRVSVRAPSKFWSWQAGLLLLIPPVPFPSPFQVTQIRSREVVLRRQLIKLPLRRGTGPRSFGNPTADSL